MKISITLITTILILGIIFYILHSIRINNVCSTSQHDEMRSLTIAINDDIKIKELLQSQNIKFEDTKCSWHSGRLFLYLYVSNKGFDVNPVLKRIKEIAEKDDFKSLRPMITINFESGTPESIQPELFKMKDIIIK